jgi:hypothetical protein
MVVQGLRIVRDTLTGVRACVCVHACVWVSVCVRVCACVCVCVIAHIHAAGGTGACWWSRTQGGRRWIGARDHTTHARAAARRQRAHAQTQAHRHTTPRGGHTCVHDVLQLHTHILLSGDLVCQHQRRAQVFVRVRQCVWGSAARHEPHRLLCHSPPPHTLTICATDALQHPLPLLQLAPLNKTAHQQQAAAAAVSCVCTYMHMCARCGVRACCSARAHVRATHSCRVGCMLMTPQLHAPQPSGLVAWRICAEDAA